MTKSSFNHLLNTNPTIASFPCEILFNIFSHLSKTKLNQVKQVCSTFKRVYHLFPYLSITDILDHLYQGNLSFADSNFTTNDPLIADHILTILRSPAFNQFRSKHDKATTECGRFGILLSIWQHPQCDGLELPDSLGDLQDHVQDFFGQTCRLLDVPSYWWFHYASPGVFEWLSPPIWTNAYKFLLAMHNENIPVSYELAKEFPPVRPGGNENYSLIFETLQDRPTTSLQLLFYPIEQKNDRLLYEQYLQTCQQFTDDEADDFFGAVVRDMIAAGDMPLHVPHNGFFSWLFSIDHPHTVQQLLADQRVDLSRWQHFPLLLAVRKGNLESVNLLLSDSRMKTPPHWILSGSIRSGNIEIFKSLLQYIDPSADENKCIQMACRNKSLEWVKILLSDPRVDPAANMNAAIGNASFNSDPKVFELILADPRVDPSDNNSRALINCASSGHLDRVKLLMLDSRVDPSASNNQAFIEAARWGELNVLKQLLIDPRVNPTAYNNEAFCLAVERGHVDIVHWLFTLPGVEPGCQDNRPLISAVRCRSLPMVKFLLTCPNVDPSAQNNRAFGLVFFAVYGKAYWDGDDYDHYYKQSKHILRGRRQRPKDPIYSSIDIGKLLLQDPRVKAKIREMYPTRKDYGLRKSVFEDCI